MMRCAISKMMHTPGCLVLRETGVQLIVLRRGSIEYPRTLLHWLLMSCNTLVCYYGAGQTNYRRCNWCKLHVALVCRPSNVIGQKHTWLVRNIHIINIMYNYIYNYNWFFQTQSHVRSTCILPVPSKTNSASLWSIPPRYNYYAKPILSHISTSVYSQLFIKYSWLNWSNAAWTKLQHEDLNPVRSIEGPMF